jgi:hypothetical protein
MPLLQKALKLSAWVTRGKRVKDKTANPRIHRDKFLRAKLKLFMTSNLRIRVKSPQRVVGRGGVYAGILQENN